MREGGFRVDCVCVPKREKQDWKEHEKKNICLSHSFAQFLKVEEEG